MPPSRCALTPGGTRFANEAAGSARAPLGPLPLELENTITLNENGNKTTLAIHTVPFGVTEADEIAFFDNLRDTKSLEQGFGGTLNQLESYLQKMRTS